MKTAYTMKSHNLLPSLIIFLFLLLAGGGIYGQHTFSIVAVDTVTGEVGGAGATCLTSAQCGGCGGAVIISNLVPGKGAMNAQASVCIPNFNLSNGINEINMDQNAQQTLNFVLANDACQFGDTNNRQYGIVTLDTLNGTAMSVSYTGDSALNYANHIVGPNYAIQGNILLGQEILDSMEAGFLNTPGDLCTKLMAALQGANVVGADTRCAPNGLSSRSSFIRVAKPTDQAGQFWLNLIVPQTFVGVDPIDSLQTLFDQFKLQNGRVDLPETGGFRVFPNPAKDVVKLDFTSAKLLDPVVSVYNTKGEWVGEQVFSGLQDELEVNLELPAGLYLLVVTEAESGLHMSRKIVIR